MTVGTDWRAAGTGERPVLVTVTRTGAGSADALVARALAVQAARRAGGVQRVACTLGPVADDPRDVTRLLRVLDARGRGAVVVPVGLAADALPELQDLQDAGGPAAVALTPSLGPHPLLVEALNRQVAAAGARPTDAVVLAAPTLDGGPAGVQAVAALLGARRGGAPVRVATLDARGPAIDQQVLGLRRRHTGRVVVAPYVLGPDRVALRVRAMAEVSGADGVAPPVGAHGLLVELVARRYLAATRALGRAQARPAAPARRSVRPAA